MGILQDQKCLLSFLPYMTCWGTVAMWLITAQSCMSTRYLRYTNFLSIYILRSARAECYDSLLFSGASSIPLCYVLFPATLLHQLFFHPLSPHLGIYFLVHLSILLFPNSCTIPFWDFYFLPFCVHAQTKII